MLVISSPIAIFYVAYAAEIIQVDNPVEKGLRRLVRARYTEKMPGKRRQWITFN